jgi:hypothetical protein
MPARERPSIGATTVERREMQVRESGMSQMRGRDAVKGEWGETWTMIRGKTGNS